MCVFKPNVVALCFLALKLLLPLSELRLGDLALPPRQARDRRGGPEAAVHTRVATLWMRKSRLGEVT